MPVGLGIASVLLFHADFAAIGEVRQGRSSLCYGHSLLGYGAAPCWPRSFVSAVWPEPWRAGVSAMTAGGGMDVLAWLVLAAVVMGNGRPLLAPAERFSGSAQGGGWVDDPRSPVQFHGEVLPHLCVLAGELHEYRNAMQRYGRSEIL
jgi:hypothetical protein